MEKYGHDHTHVAHGLDQLGRAYFLTGQFKVHTAMHHMNIAYFDDG